MSQRSRHGETILAEGVGTGSAPTTPLTPPATSLEAHYGWLVKREAFEGDDFTPSGFLDKLTYRNLKQQHLEDSESRTDELVQVLDGASEKLTNLKAVEERRIEDLEAKCRKTEASEKSVLTDHQRKLEGVATELTTLETRLNDALAAIVGVEQHMAQANTRCTRARHVTEVIKHFEAFSGLAPEQMRQQLDALGGARANARKELAPTMGKHLLDRQRRRRTASDADPEDFTDGTGFYLLDVDYGARVETNVMSAGIPEVYVARSQTSQAVRSVAELSNLSRQLMEVAPNAANVDMYINWLGSQLIEDCFLLIECYYDATEQSASAAAARQQQEQASTQQGGSRGAAVKKVSAAAEEDAAQYIENELLQFIAYVAELHAVLTSSGQGLADTFFDQTIADIADEVNSLIIDKAFLFLIDRLTRDAKLLDAICSSMPHARSEFFMRVMQEVVEPFVSRTITEAEKVLNIEIEHEKKLDVKGKMAIAPKVADAIEYHQTLLADLSSSVAAFTDRIVHVFGSDSQVEYLKGTVDQLYGHRKTQAALVWEPQLLKRRFTITTDHYLRKLQVNISTDGSFSVREAHHSKAKEFFKATERAITRELALASAVEVGGMVKYFATELLERIVRYAKEELVKMKDALKSDVASWTRARISKLQGRQLQPGGAEGPEPIAAGLEMVMWVQSLVVEFDQLCEKHMLPLLPQFPGLLSDIDTSRDARADELDYLCHDAVRLCASGLVSRTLAILLHEQKKVDYRPKDEKKKKDAAEVEMLAPECSPACAWACATLSTYLQQATPFIGASGAALDNDGESDGSPLGKSVSGAGRASVGHVRTQSLGLTTPLKAGGGASYDEVVGDAGGVGGGVRDTTWQLRRILSGDFAASVTGGYGATFTRTVGVGLYRGISAHLRSFTVNDRGALVLKKDVAAFREAVEPLCRADIEDGPLIASLFNLLKEAANLLLVPLDHIRSVKSNGLLRYVSEEEKEIYLRMREDVRKAFRYINR